MADKNPGGRPPKYETAEALEQAINEYFELCEPKPVTGEGDDNETVILTDKHGKPVMTQKVPTTAGLARHLGYVDRQSLYDLKKKDKFSCLIKAARLAIEEYHEGRLGSGESCVGSIFWMKNHGWTDKQEVEQSGTIVIKIDEQDGKL